MLADGRSHALTAMSKIPTGSLLPSKMHVA
jgi:hypothetical protein